MSTENDASALTDSIYVYTNFRNHSQELSVIWLRLFTV